MFTIAAAAAKSLQSCPTLCDPIDGSPPGSPIPGILQARTLEWVAISFSNAWQWKGKVKSLSRADSSRLHGLQPTRLFHPWDFPGKSTGVGCHCLLHFYIISMPDFRIFSADSKDNKIWQQNSLDVNSKGVFQGRVLLKYFWKTHLLPTNGTVSELWASGVLYGLGCELVTADSKQWAQGCLRYYYYWAFSQWRKGLHQFTVLSKAEI